MLWVVVGGTDRGRSLGGRTDPTPESTGRQYRTLSPDPPLGGLHEERETHRPSSDRRDRVTGLPCFTPIPGVGPTALDLGVPTPLNGPDISPTTPTPVDTTPSP